MTPMREAQFEEGEERSFLIGFGAIERPVQPSLGGTARNNNGGTTRPFSIRTCLTCVGLIGLVIGVVAGYSYRGQQPSSSIGVVSSSPDGAEDEVLTIDLLGSKKHGKSKSKAEDDDHGHKKSSSKKSSSKKSPPAHHHRDDDDDKSAATASAEEESCDDGKYSKRTLKLAYELPFAALFWGSPPGVRKYEASDVILVDDYAYAVCDSSWAIAKFNAQLTPFGTDNTPIYDLEKTRFDQDEQDSGYEAILHANGTFYVIRESVQHDDEQYHAIVEELNLQEDVDGYTIGLQCSTEFAFEGASKGFEGAISVYDLNNELVVLGLCEGNHCSEKEKKDRGNGRFVAMRKTFLDDGTCTWATVRTINIPHSVNFLDYSAATISPTGRVAITSQEDSKLWVGQLTGQVVADNGETLWDVDAMEFDESAGKMYDFPKNDMCETVYCNIEGVHWISDDLVMAVSDKMKGKGKQDFVCFDKDQSVHVFILPE
jgi:hypothetical protein